MRPNAYETRRLTWNGLAVTVRYNPDCSEPYRRFYGHPLAHLEISADAPLPMAETGYRSHYCNQGDVEAEGGPVSFVLNWLHFAAREPGWLERQEAARQMSLF